MQRVIKLSLLFALLVFASMGSARLVTTHAQQGDEHGPPEIIRLPANPNGIAFQPTAGSTSKTTAIFYGGGPLISTPTAYVIWYGNWNQNNGSDTAAGQQIVTDFLNSVGGSPYFDINQTYSAGGVAISGSVTYGGSTTDAYSQGTSLGDASILTIVNSAISSGRLPYNQFGVYFVLTSSDVNETTGLCTNYCGWHTAGTANAGHVRYAFVGNANRCLGSCAAQTIGPNGNAGVDGMVSVIAHELEEATTDPDPRSGWSDRRGQENADKCAWTFGHAQYQVANGAWANMKLGTRDFLIQRNLLHGSQDFCMVNSTQN
jgi:Phosphate-induced protein 1 conserved region